MIETTISNKLSHSVREHIGPGLLSKRISYKPFEYIQARDYTKQQQRVHWLGEEVSLSSDINDFKTKLTPSERNLIGNILKSFAQTEVAVEDYWSSKVTRWFPKPEIQAMAVTFASFESIHSEAYSLINEGLGLDDFTAFLQDKEALAKIERLSDVDGKSVEEIAKSLAIFSAFTEGVNLFSSFAILMSFQMRNLMKGIGQIVEFSVRDESLHSRAGCWLFNQLVREYSHQIDMKKLSVDIEEACRLSVKLEFDFIDKAFEMGDIENLNPTQVKNFIMARANDKMIELGFKAIYETDSELLKQMEWFGHLTSGKTQTDFFASRVTDYTKSTADWSDL